MILEIGHSARQKFSASLGLLLVRLPVGFYFVLTGWMKVHDIGVKTFVDTYYTKAPLPVPVARAYLSALPFVEIIIGICLILGFFTDLIGLIASLLLISIIVAVQGVLDRHGPMPVPNTPVIFLGVTLCLMLIGPGKISIDALFRGKRKSHGP